VASNRRPTGKTVVFGFLACIILGLTTSACALSLPKSASPEVTNLEAIKNDEVPIPEQGLMVFHTYNTYEDAGDTGSLWLYDFATGSQPVNLSASWAEVSAPMNAVFSADGKWLIFMGVADEEWNLFAWEVHSSAQPTNLTGNGPNNWTRNEDPKFNLAGDKVYWKRSGNIAVAPFSILEGEPTLDLENLTMLTSGEANWETGSGEKWMPIPSFDDSELYFVAGTGAEADIHKMSLEWNDNAEVARVEVMATAPVVDAVQLSAYYPIIDHSRAERTLYYTRWLSQENRNDAVWFLRGETQMLAPFNLPGVDNSDPWPVNGSDLVLFITTTGPDNVYEIRSGNLETGAQVLIPLGQAPEVAKLHHLGPAYWAPVAAALSENAETP
jgi:hypothetical protein